MSYQDIINRADILCPNNLTPEYKMSIIYEHEKKLFRTIYRKKTATVMDIVKDQPLYPLDFHRSKIIRVVWNGQSINYEDINNEQAQGDSFLYTYENSLGRYPTPEQDVEKGIFIFHFEEPAQPTLTADTSFDPAFPDILLFDLCKEIEIMKKNPERIADFERKYRSELEEFKRANPEPELPPMRVE